MKVSTNIRAGQGQKRSSSTDSTSVSIRPIRSLCITRRSPAARASDLA